MIEDEAVADLDSIHEFLSAYSEASAERVYEELKRKILSLDRFPRRCPQAPESARSTIELRHLLVGNHRVIFSILGTTVHVYRVVSAARGPLDPSHFL